MLSKSIYAKSITNLSDARYCAGMGVEFLGVCLDENSADYLPLSAFTEIKNWLVGVEWIAETTLAGADEIKAALQLYGLNRVAVADDIVAATLRKAGVDVLLKITLADVTNNSSDQTTIIHLDDEEVDDFLNEHAEKLTNAYLSGDFSEATLEKLNGVETLIGVVLTGGKEDRPGFKDMDQLINSIEIFETD